MDHHRLYFFGDLRRCDTGRFASPLSLRWLQSIPLQLFALFFSTIYGLFSERDSKKANAETIKYALIIFFTGIGGGLCQFLSSVAFSRSGEALTMRMRSISFASMLRQEVAWFDKEENNLGALVTQLSSDTSSLKVGQRSPRIRSVKRPPNLGAIRSTHGCHFQCCRRRRVRVEHCLRR